MTSLPYGGASDPNSGFSGSETSEARARTEDQSGITSARQQQVMSLLYHANRRGLTWKDLAAATGWHHGQASGALSNLHKDNRIARLTETRNRCKVYVHISHTLGRETEPHGGRTVDTLLDDMAALLRTVPACTGQESLPHDPETCTRCCSRALVQRYDRRMIWGK